MAVHRAPAWINRTSWIRRTTVLSLLHRAGSDEDSAGRPMAQAALRGYQAPDQEEGRHRHRDGKRRNQVKRRDVEGKHGSRNEGPPRGAGAHEDGRGRILSARDFQFPANARVKCKHRTPDEAAQLLFVTGITPDQPAAQRDRETRDRCAAIGLLLQRFIRRFAGLSSVNFCRLAYPCRCGAACRHLRVSTCHPGGSAARGVAV